MSNLLMGVTMTFVLVPFLKVFQFYELVSLILQIKQIGLSKVKSLLLFVLNEMLNLYNFMNNSINKPQFHISNFKRFVYFSIFIYH